MIYIRKYLVSCIVRTMVFVELQTLLHYKMIHEQMIMSYISKYVQLFHIDYLQEMDITLKIKDRIERKINKTLLALLPNRRPATSTRENANKEPS